jgi:hypothetical protein
MAGRRKRRVTQHLMEEESFRIARAMLPPAWVVHEYRPDYGIDLTIEPFEEVDHGVTETLGEHLFVQLKSVATLATRKLRVTPRYNVEKRPLRNGTSSSTDIHDEIEVIPFQIDTNDLVTVQAMGAAATVMLILVALDTKRVFFICLNDLIDKIVVAEDEVFAQKNSTQIFIPVSNEITALAESLVPLKMYAKRAKFYTAIAKFAYQYHELQYAAEDVLAGATLHDSYLARVRHFISILKRLTIWDAGEYWTLVGHYQQQIGRLEAIIDGKESSVIGVQAEVETLWQGLNALGRTFEEVTREWFLPTYLGSSLNKI